MKYLVQISVLLILLSSCRKKEYKSYLGTYSCTVEEHLDSTGYNWDTTYTANEDLIEANNSEMQFRELTIPYKYIDKSGKYEATHLVPGLVWGRQITLNEDGLLYYHHEATDDSFWYIRFTGTLVN